jgi:hypothetical protein
LHRDLSQSLNSCVTRTCDEFVAASIEHVFPHLVPLGSVLWTSLSISTRAALCICGVTLQAMLRPSLIYETRINTRSRTPCGRSLHCGVPRSRWEKPLNLSPDGRGLCDTKEPVSAQPLMTLTSDIYPDWSVAQTHLGPGTNDILRSGCNACYS